MWKVLFGKNDDFARAIVGRLDSTRYKADFASIEDADLYRYDCVIPFLLKDYEVLERNESLEGMKFWHPSSPIVKLCHDKLAINRLLLQGAFADVVPPLIKRGSTSFPYILKRRIDANGHRSHIVMNRNDEAAIEDLIQSPKYFRQAYIPGPVEYALHVLMINQKTVYSQVVKYEMDRDYYVKGRNLPAQSATLIPDDGHMEIFAPLLASLGYTGTCCINYKFLDGQPKFMEINPRFGYSLCMDINRYLEAYIGSLAHPDVVPSVRQRMARSIGARLSALRGRL